MKLINIYGPNRDSPSFITELHNELAQYERSSIIAGDFNLVLNPEIDTKDYVNVNNPNARDHVVEMILDLNLVDVRRELNLEKRQYTWRKQNTNKQARLDFF